MLSVCITMAFGQQKKSSIAPAKKPAATPQKTVSTPTKKPVAKPAVLKEQTKTIAKPITQKTATNPVIEQPTVKTEPATKQVVTENKAPNSTHQKEVITPLMERQMYDSALQNERKNSYVSKTEAAEPSQNKVLPNQYQNNNAFGIGLRYGKNFATLNTTGLASKNKVQQRGNLFGLFFNIPLSQNMSLQPEVNYSQRGLAYAYQEDYDRLKTNYIEVPLLLKLSFGNRTKFFFNLGGYGAYWLSGELANKTDGKTSTLKYPFDKDLSDGIADNRIDYGAMAGLGISTEIFGGSFFIEGRYTYGLADISKFETNPSNYTSSKNQIIGASAGYLFKF